MKKIFLAALTVLSLVGAGVANAQSLSHSAPPQQHQQSANQYNWLAGGD